MIFISSYTKWCFDRNCIEGKKIANLSKMQFSIFYSLLIFSLNFKMIEKYEEKHRNYVNRKPHFSAAIMLSLSLWSHVVRGLYIWFRFKLKLTGRKKKKFSSFCGRENDSIGAIKTIKIFILPRDSNCLSLLSWEGKKSFCRFLVYLGLPFASDVFKFICFSGILNVRFTIEGFPLFSSGDYVESKIGDETKMFSM